MLDCRRGWSRPEQCPVNFSQAGSYTVFVTFVSLFPYIVANFNESLPVGPSSESFTPSVTGVTFTQGDTVCGEWYCATLSASVDTYGLPTPESGDVGTVTFSWTGPDGSGSVSAPVPDSIFTSYPSAVAGVPHASTTLTATFEGTTYVDTNGETVTTESGSSETIDLPYIPSQRRASSRRFVLIS